MRPWKYTRTDLQLLDQDVCEFVSLDPNVPPSGYGCIYVCVCVYVFVHKMELSAISSITQLVWLMLCERKIGFRILFRDENVAENWKCSRQPQQTPGDNLFNTSIEGRGSVDVSLLDTAQYWGACVVHRANSSWKYILGTLMGLTGIYSQHIRHGSFTDIIFRVLVHFVKNRQDIEQFSQEMKSSSCQHQIHK